MEGWSGGREEEADWREGFWGGPGAGPEGGGLGVRWGGEIWFAPFMGGEMDDLCGLRGMQGTQKLNGQT